MAAGAKSLTELYYTCCIRSGMKLLFQSSLVILTGSSPRAWENAIGLSGGNISHRAIVSSEMDDDFSSDRF